MVMTLVGLFALVALLVALTAGPGSALSLTKPKKATGTGPPPITAQTSTVPQSTSSDGKADCGGVTMYKPDGTPWACTFDDEFDGTSLNTNNWTVETTASNGYHSGSECYEDSPDNVSVSGGTLNLTVHKVASFRCPAVGITNYTAGMVYTLDHFSQTYGYFEVKAKLPPATVKGLQTSLWLWPVNDNYYGTTWPDSGEIDIAEWYSQYPNLEIPYIHYVEAGGQGFGSQRDQRPVQRVEHHGLQHLRRGVDAEQHHHLDGRSNLLGRHLGPGLARGGARPVQHAVLHQPDLGHGDHHQRAHQHHRQGAAGHLEHRLGPGLELSVPPSRWCRRAQPRPMS